MSGVGSAQDSMADQDGASVSYHAHGSWFVGQDQSAPPSPMVMASHSSTMFKPLLSQLFINKFL